MVQYVFLLMNGIIGEWYYNSGLVHYKYLWTTIDEW